MGGTPMGAPMQRSSQRCSADVQRHHQRQSLREHGKGSPEQDHPTPDHVGHGPAAPSAKEDKLNPEVQKTNATPLSLEPLDGIRLFFNTCVVQFHAVYLLGLHPWRCLFGSVMRDNFVVHVAVVIAYPAVTGFFVLTGALATYQLVPALIGGATGVPGEGSGGGGGGEDRGQGNCPLRNGASSRAGDSSGGATDALGNSSIKGSSGDRASSGESSGGGGGWVSSSSRGSHGSQPSPMSVALRYLRRRMQRIVPQAHLVTLFTWTLLKMLYVPQEAHQASAVGLTPGDAEPLEPGANSSPNQLSGSCAPTNPFSEVWDINSPPSHGSWAPQLHLLSYRPACWPADISVGQLVSTLLFQGNRQEAGGWMLFAWTLAIQVQFWVLFTICLLALQPRSPGFHSRVVCLALVLLGVSLAWRVQQAQVSGIRVPFPFLQHPADGLGFHLNLAFISKFYASALSRLSDLSSGILLGCFILSPDAITAARQRAPLVAAAAAASFLFLVAINAPGVPTEYDPSEDLGDVGVYVSMVGVLGLGCPVAVAALIGWVLLCSDPVAHALSALFGSKVWKVPARLSYSVYMVHTLVLVGLWHVMSAAGAAPPYLFYEWGGAAPTATWRFMRQTGVMLGMWGVTHGVSSVAAAMLEGMAQRVFGSSSSRPGSARM